MIYVSEAAAVGFLILSSIAVLITLPIALATLSYPEYFNFHDLDFTKKEIKTEIVIVISVFLLSWVCIGLAGNFLKICFSESEVVKEEKIYLYNKPKTNTNKNMILYEGKDESTSNDGYALLVRNEENEKEVLELIPSYTMIKYTDDITEPYVLKKYLRNESWIFYSTSDDYSIYFPKSFKSTDMEE